MVGLLRLVGLALFSFAPTCARVAISMPIPSTHCLGKIIPLGLIFLLHFPLNPLSRTWLSATRYRLGDSLMPFLSTLAAHSRTYADWDFDSSYSADFGPFTLDAPVHKSPHWMIYDSQ